MKSALRPYVTAGIALVGVGIIVVTPVTPPPPDIQVRAVQLTSGEATTAADPTVGLVMGGSGTPIPGTSYVDAANNLYIDNQLHPIYPDTTYPGVLANGLFTPEGLYPLTGVKTLPFNYPLDANGFPAASTSVGQGDTILENAINANTAAGDTSTVFGYSQSSTISGLVMQLLDPSGKPSDLPVQFLLVGDPSAPNGGLLERFNGYETTSGDTHSLPLNIPSLGVSFDGATPADDFQTSIYSLEYDGFTDFPRYPIDLLSDINAFLGIATIHGTYLHGGVDGSGPTPEQIADATLLPGSEDYGTGNPDSLTNYYIIDETPPLVSLLPKSLQDLLGPDLTYLINLGYGDGSLGYSDTAANVPTPFGLFPDVSMANVFSTLATDTQQGIQAFEADMANPAAGVSSTASLVPSSVSDASTTTTDPASLTDIVNAFSAALSSAYATLLPTADIFNALTTSLPTYDLSLFTGNLQDGDLLDAFGLPAAANAALYTLAAGFEFDVIENAAQAIAADFSGLS
jgi:hypothetical protein